MSPVRKKIASPYHILSSPYPPPPPNITAELTTLAVATGSYVRKGNMPSPSRYLSMVRCACSKRPACFSCIVHAGTTPFAVRARTDPIACASACGVMSRNHGLRRIERMQAVLPFRLVLRRGRCRHHPVAALMTLELLVSPPWPMQWSLRPQELPQRSADGVVF